MDNEIVTGKELLKKMKEEFEIRSQKLSLLKNSLENIEDEIDLVKGEIRARIDNKADLLEKQINLLAKIQELDEYIIAIASAHNYKEVQLPEKEEGHQNFPKKSQSLMVSGNFCFGPSYQIVQYFQQFGNIIKVTDNKNGFGSNSKNGFRYIFLKFDNVKSVDTAVENSPHNISGRLYQARRGKDY